MVLRNTTTRSGEALEPCRQPVNAGDAKKALSRFIAACRTTAAATTIVLAVSSAGCGNMRPYELHPYPQPVAEPDPQPAEEPEELNAELLPLGGSIAPAQITTDAE